MIAVLDTNVLVSGIFFSGAPYQILKSWRDGVIRFVLSNEIIEEYIEVANTLNNRFSGVDFNPILNLIIAHSHIVEASPLPHQVCEDADDDKFIACAIAGKSSLIISGDKQLLKVSGYRGISIVAPRPFVEQYLKKEL